MLVFVARNNMELSSIVVTLMPSRSNVQYKSDVHRSVQVAIHACSVILDDHCKQKHQPHLKDKHACQVEVLAPVKTPVLSMPDRLITQITSQNGREELEKNGERWPPLTQGVAQHHNVVRVIKVKNFITTNTDNWLGNFRTPNGDVGKPDNAHLLTLLANEPKAQLVTHLVTLGCHKTKDIPKSPRYDHFVATGSSTLPVEEAEAGRDRGNRPIISVVDLTYAGPVQGCGSVQYHNSRRDDYNNRDRSRSGRRHRSRSSHGHGDGDLRNTISPRRGGNPSYRGRGQLRGFRR